MSVLVVVAHPDDESIGMAGTIAKHSNEGDKVFGIYLTNGVESRQKDLKKIKARKLAADLAAKEIGLEWIGKYDFPDNALDSVPLLDIVKVIEEVKFKVRPSIVYTHHFGDLNIDHQITFKAIMTAFRPQPNEKCKEIRTFETASSTEYGVYGNQNIFVPNLFVNIENFWIKKEIALKHYKMEMHKKPHARSIDSLNHLSKLRGMSVGVNRAEAFHVVRKIIDD